MEKGDEITISQTDTEDIIMLQQVIYSLFKW